jgi:hypothetical protein
MVKNSPIPFLHWNFSEDGAVVEVAATGKVLEPLSQES